MGIRKNSIFVVLAVIVWAVPLWSQSTSIAKVKFGHPVDVGGFSLPAGRYEFQTNPNDKSVTILRWENYITESRPGQGYSWDTRTRVLATLPAQWVKLASRASKTEVVSSNRHVQRIEFRGEEYAIQFSNGNTGRAAS